MTGVSLLFYLLAFDKKISAVDGFILFIGIVLFIIYCIYDAKHNKEQSEGIIQDLESSSKKMMASNRERLPLSGIVNLKNI